MKNNPDFEQLLAVLRREIPERPVLFEFCIDQAFLRRRLESEGGVWIDPEGSPMDQVSNWIRGYAASGYDFATFPSWVTDFVPHMKDDRAQGASKGMAHGGVITDWESFERYEWPDPDSGDFSLLEQAKSVMPKGMKLIPFSPGTILEGLVHLCGYEDFCYLLADDVELVEKITDAIGERVFRFYERATEFETVGAAFVPDDWGFKTQLFISPAQMRTLIFPWHRRIVDLLHSRGLPALLHSCGKMDMIWEDICDLGYDGKHSYEDTIEPVETVYDRLGEKIAILGGLDIDFLSRSTPDAVEKRAREMLERSATKGGYALGSGNSITPYIPYENFCALLRAAGKIKA